MLKLSTLTDGTTHRVFGTPKYPDAYFSVIDEGRAVTSDSIELVGLELKYVNRIAAGEDIIDEIAIVDRYHGNYKFIGDFAVYMSVETPTRHIGQEGEYYMPVEEFRVAVAAHRVEESK